MWLAAWIIALIATAPNPKGFPMIWVFPFGLMYVLQWKTQSFSVMMAVTWTPYVVLTLLAMLTRRRRVFLALFAVFCVLLAFNVAGCHMMLAGLRKPA